MTLRSAVAPHVLPGFAFKDIMPQDTEHVFSAPPPPPRHLTVLVTPPPPPTARIVTS